MPNIEISDDAMAFLQSRAVPLQDTTVTVVDKIIRRLKELEEVSNNSACKTLSFKMDAMPSVKFTSILGASVDGQKAPQSYWNNILEDVIKACINHGHSATDIKAHMAANIHMGKYQENGYRYVPAADFSFQGMEANRVFKNIAALAAAFDIPVKINIRWQDNEQAAYPNALAEIVYP